MLRKNADGSTTTIPTTFPEPLPIEQKHAGLAAANERLLAQRAYKRMAELHQLATTQRQQRRAAAQKAAPSLADLARRLRELKG